MSNIKEKAKNFWEEHKVDIIWMTSGAAIAIGAGVIAYKSYCGGFLDGGAYGCQLMIDWLDKTFPGESHARELYDRYAKEHPDQIVHRKGFGKWSK